MTRSQNVFDHIPYGGVEAEEPSMLAPARSQGYEVLVSDFMLLVWVYEGMWPTLSLKALSSCSQYMVSVFIISELGNQCFLTTISFLQMLDYRRNIT